MQHMMAEARLDRDLREAEAVESRQKKSKIVCHYHVSNYRRSGNFHVKNNSHENFCVIEFSRFIRSTKFF